MHVSLSLILFDYRRQKSVKVSMSHYFILMATQWLLSANAYWALGDLLLVCYDTIVQTMIFLYSFLNKWNVKKSLLNVINIVGRNTLSTSNCYLNETMWKV